MIILTTSTIDLEGNPIGRCKNTIAFEEKKENLSPQNKEREKHSMLKVQPVDLWAKSRRGNKRNG
jgi:hypothetical protein